MTAPDDKGPSPEEEFHHELDELFDNNHEDFVNWMQSKGWRDQSIQLPDMQEWHERNLASQRIYVEEARVKALRADFDYEMSKKQLEDLKEKKAEYGF